MQGFERFSHSRSQGGGRFGFVALSLLPEYSIHGFRGRFGLVVASQSSYSRLLQNFGSHYFALVVVHAHLSFLKLLAESCRSLAICRPSLCAGVVQQRLAASASALAVPVVSDPSEPAAPSPKLRIFCLILDSTAKNFRAFCLALFKIFRALLGDPPLWEGPLFKPWNA